MCALCCFWIPQVSIKGCLKTTACLCDAKLMLYLSELASVGCRGHAQPAKVSGIAPAIHIHSVISNALCVDNPAFLNPLPTLHNTPQMLQCTPAQRSSTNRYCWRHFCCYNNIGCASDVHMKSASYCSPLSALLQAAHAHQNKSVR